MKHLYIIGNGFDIFTGLKSRYADFQHWLKYTYPFVYENMDEVYKIKETGEWWYNFEIQLGKLDVQQYIRKFPPSEESIEERRKNVKQQRTVEKQYNLPPDFRHDSDCARRLKGLLDVLRYCFEKWVEDIIGCIVAPKYMHIERRDSFFINFNYTDVLQRLYRIKDEQILFIHGRALKHEHLVFGHNSRHIIKDMVGEDERQTNFELDCYIKEPYDYIFKHEELLTILSDVEYVHVYGLSISEVDVDYLDWIEMNTPSNSNWEFSWYSEEDKNRIDQFIWNHWSLRNRFSLVQLQEISREEALKDE